MLPDIASHASAQIPSSLQWVGMEGISIPLSIAVQSDSRQIVTAKANIYVNLHQANAKGIHMSRLYSILNQFAKQECSRETIEALLKNMVLSQSDISSNAKVTLAFELLVEKAALLSDETGYQSYAITILSEKKAKDFIHEIEITIPYSSTCPCSASLARQLYANEIDRRFPNQEIDKSSLLQWVQSEAGSVATPHSQRSYAYVRLVMENDEWPNLAKLIRQLESSIGTPTQTAVKRNDEQEFARLNATNLMFCEDAARRVKNTLGKMDAIKSYWLKVEHQESLHAHNAVVIDQLE